MNRLITIFACLCVMSSIVGGRELRLKTTSFEDYIPLLENAGFHLESFDISDLADSSYYIQLQIREYEAGKTDFKTNMMPYALDNRTMASEFKDTTIPAEEMAVPEKGIYTLGRKVNIGLRSVTDSTKAVLMDIPKIGTMPLSLKMRKVHNPDTGDDLMIEYDARPFKVDSIRINDFTPLVWVGSFWWDDDFKIFRSCGEKEISSLSSEIVDNSPHYYVIGIVVTPK